MIEPIGLVDEGLGNSTYLLDLGDGRGLLVDPSRDLRHVRQEAERAGLAIAYVAETHLHADFVSGARQLQARDGATVLASAAGNRAFGHVGLADGDELDLGGLTLRAWATPGHTDEHLAYVLLDGRRPIGVFTGGSLLVGSAARTDLVDAARTEELARAQFRSIQRLLALPDETAIWPTHGAGSFCSAPPGSERTTTIGAERAHNALLTEGTEDAFVARLIAGMGSYPTYFGRLQQVNRAGPRVVDEAAVLPRLDVAHVERLLADGATVVDARPVAAFGAGHIPGAVSIPLRDQFASWLGWVLDDRTPIVVVRDPGQDPAEIVWQAWKIGYENLAGELAGGMKAWPGELARIDVVNPREAAELLPKSTLLDVRQDSEYRAGHLPGSVSVELGSVQQADLPDGPLLTMCGHGERAMTAASLAARAGRPTTVVAGGPDEVAEAAGVGLVEGS
ncbi:MBL fold metallo-hydrolase [Flindersiella endophytica]